MDNIPALAFTGILTFKVLSSLENSVLIPSTDTVVTDDKFEPITLIPAPLQTCSGKTDLISSASLPKNIKPFNVEVPHPFVTAMEPEIALDGTTTLIKLLLTTVNMASMPPSLTFLTFKRLLPFILIDCPVQRDKELPLLKIGDVPLTEKVVEAL